MGCPHYRVTHDDLGFRTPNGEWVVDIREVRVSTIVRIDPYRWRCELCGETGFVDGTARVLYEEKYGE